MCGWAPPSPCRMRVTAVSKIAVSDGNPTSFSVPNRTADADFSDAIIHTHSIGRSYANAPTRLLISIQMNGGEPLPGHACACQHNDRTAGSVPLAGERRTATQRRTRMLAKKVDHGLAGVLVAHCRHVVAPRNGCRAGAADGSGQRLGPSSRIIVTTRHDQNRPLQLRENFKRKTRLPSRPSRVHVLPASSLRSMPSGWQASARAAATASTRPSTTPARVFRRVKAWRLFARTWRTIRV